MFRNQYYEDDLHYINDFNLPWEMLEGKSILITGATGLIGSGVVDSLMYRNKYYDSKVSIWALSRNENIIRDRFGSYIENRYFKYLIQDVTSELNVDSKIDYIIHAASKGDPYSFTTDPVGVMNANYLGMYKVLELARKTKTSKVVFISSGEIYGNQPSGNQRSDGFIETDYGYINLLNSRSGYASAKRAAETLCSAYNYQYNINVSIARPCHTYGYTMLDTDNRVVGEFLRKANKKETIVMKSKGLQVRSYCYLADTVTALFTILLLGESGQAYNIANRNSIISIRELAVILSQKAQIEVVFEYANEFEKKGYSDIERAVLDPSNLEKLGWSAKYGISDGISHVLKMMK